MKLNWTRRSLPLKNPFTISRGTLYHQDCLIVSLSHEGFTGFGEVTCNAYYGHTYATLEDSLQRVSDRIADTDLLHPGELYERCQEVIPHDRFALSAIDGAAYDLYGKAHRITTREVLGLPPTANVTSSFTLGIDSIDEMVRKYHEEPNWPIYKIKLGTPHDVDIVRRLRQETTVVIRVDANCAWTVEETIENSHCLAELGVEFIEQPLRADAPEADHLEVFKNSRLPIIADESCRTESDVAKCRDQFHGINVKLCKCGGLTPASQMLRRGRDFGLKTMVGCMIESTIGISTAAQLLPLLDYADLDGAAQLAEDSADGVRVENGWIHLTGEPGHGIRKDA